MVSPVRATRTQGDDERRTNWNDSSIRATNSPAVQALLLDANIIVVVQNADSDYNQIFTTFPSAKVPAFAHMIGTSRQPQFDGLVTNGTIILQRWPGPVEFWRLVHLAAGRNHEHHLPSGRGTRLFQIFGPGQLHLLDPELSASWEWYLLPRTPRSMVCKRFWVTLTMFKSDRTRTRTRDLIGTVHWTAPRGPAGYIEVLVLLRKPRGSSLRVTKNNMRVGEWGQLQY